MVDISAGSTTGEPTDGAYQPCAQSRTSRGHHPGCWCRCSEVVLQEGEQLRLVVFARFQISQRVALVRVHLQLVRFVGTHQPIDQLRGVVEVHILINQSVDDEQTVISANEIEEEGNGVSVSSVAAAVCSLTYSSGNFWI